VRALLSDGGFKVAALAIVPIVLLAPPALLGIRALLHRPSKDGAPDPLTASPPAGRNQHRPT